VGLTGSVPVEPGAPGRREGLGRMGALPAEVTLRQFAERVAAVLPATAGGVRIAGDPDRPVRTVAVCGGSGGPLYETAAAAGADVLLTSDLKHHAVSESQQSTGPAVCDVAHFASEWPWLPVAAEALSRDLDGRAEVLVSSRRTDPWTARVGQEAAQRSAAG
jgi:putative NIF3 family GTP cyclohydrolase 1 type 2